MVKAGIILIGNEYGLPPARIIIPPLSPPFTPFRPVVLALSRSSTIVVVSTTMMRGAAVTGAREVCKRHFSQVERRFFNQVTLQIFAMRIEWKRQVTVKGTQ